MPNDLFNPPLTASQQAVLSALLDTLVPASEDGRMPSAAEVTFDAYLRTQAKDFLPDLLDVLEQLAPMFANLSMSARCERVSEFSSANPAKFGALLARVYDCYYQNERVREQIGVVKGAVFPQGNEVTPGDLSLLDPVIENRERHRYRNP